MTPSPTPAKPPPPDGFLFDIKRYAIHDGPGIRVTCFLQGCPLSCWWCHNPESLRKLGYADEAVTRMSVARVLAEVEKDRVFMEETGGGVTFSGGEPLMQPDFLIALLRACRDRGLHTVVDTSGHAPTEVFQQVLPEADLFLYDLKILEDGAHQRFAGVSNQLILNNLRTLAAAGRPVVIRFPVVPGHTDGQDNLDALGDLVLDLVPSAPVHLLPYHVAAEAKYRRLHLQNRLEGVQPPSPERLEELRGALANRGIQVQVGAS